MNFRRTTRMMLGAVAAVAGAWAVVLAGQADTKSQESPKVEGKSAEPKKNENKKKVEAKKSAATARERLAFTLGLTEVQRVRVARIHEQLDAERAALLDGMDALLADIKRVLIDENATAEQKAAAHARLEELHQAFRKIEAERKNRLEELLNDEQKQRLAELTHPPTDSVPPPAGTMGQVVRAFRRMNLNPEQHAVVRAEQSKLEARLVEADRVRQAGFDDFRRAVSPALNDEQKVEFEAARAKWERRVKAGKAEKTPEKNAPKTTN